MAIRTETKLALRRAYEKLGYQAEVYHRPEFDPDNWVEECEQIILTAFDELHASREEQSILYPVRHWSHINDTLTLEIFLFAGLGLIVDEGERAGRRLFWPNAIHHPPPETVLLSFLINLGNSLKAIQCLLQEGLSTPAMTVLRHFTELGDAAIAASNDWQFFVDYATPVDDTTSAYTHWRSKLTPGRVRSIVNSIERDSGETASFVEQLRKGMYSWLSSFSHLGYVSQAISSAYWHHEHDIAGWNIGGSKDDRMRIIGTRASLVAWLVLEDAVSLLFRRHDWGPSSLNDSDRQMLLMHRVFSEMWLETMLPILEETTHR
jgi:hypothetical protein